MSYRRAVRPSESGEYRLPDALQAAWGRAIDDEAQSFLDLSEEQKNTIKQAFQEALTFAIQHATEVKMWRERNSAHNLEDALAKLLPLKSVRGREDVKGGEVTLFFSQDVIASIDKTNPTKLQTICRQIVMEFLKKILKSIEDVIESETSRKIGDLINETLNIQSQ